MDKACKKHYECVPTWSKCYKWFSCAAELCVDAYLARKQGCAQSYPNDGDKRDACQSAAWQVEQFFCAQSMVNPENATNPPLPPVFPKSHFPCFASGTVVWGKSGATTIESVKEGDEVLGYDVEWDQIRFTKIEKVLIHSDRDYSLNKLKTGPHSSIEVTDGHPLFSGKEWILSHRIVSQTFLISRGGKTVQVTADRQNSRRTVQQVFNLITENGTFLVGDEGIVASGRVSDEH